MADSRLQHRSYAVLDDSSDEAPGDVDMPVCGLGPTRDASDSDGNGNEDDDAFSVHSSDGNDDSSDTGELNSEFEDAWLDDYLPDASVSSSTADTGQDAPVETPTAPNAPSSPRRPSLSLEVDTGATLLVVDADGDAVASVRSPRLAGLTALQGEDSTRRSSSMRSEPGSPLAAAVHPVPVSLPLSKLSRRESSPPVPLSPSTSPHKRGNSLEVPPMSTTTKVLLNQRQSPGRGQHTAVAMAVAQPALLRAKSQSLVWGQQAEQDKKASSRLLDDWKRKEIWHDFKRAEEHVTATPAATPEPSSSRTRQYRRATSDARLDTLLETLKAEVSSPARVLSTQEEVAKASTRPSSPTAALWSPNRRRNSLLGPDGADRGHGTEASPRKARKPVVETVSSPPSSPSPAMTPVTPMLPVTGTFVASVPRVELEQSKKEKLALQLALESAQRTAVEDQETIRGLRETQQQLQDKLQQLSEQPAQLEAMERENRFLKEESQKHVMQALSAKELLKTLRDQLALTAKSEEQLKLQTRQLLQQNQSLQSDLLEKIAAETAKIHKMARLSAENESLLEELERKESVASERDNETRQHARVRALRRLLRAKRRAMLAPALDAWATAARDVADARRTAFELLVDVSKRLELRRKAGAMSWLKLSAASERHSIRTRELQQCVDAAVQERNASRTQQGFKLLGLLVARWERRRVAEAFGDLMQRQRAHVELRTSLVLAACKLRLVLQTRQKTRALDAFRQWQFVLRREEDRRALLHTQELTRNLAEAKECVFSLSRAKTRSEEKLQAAKDDARRLETQRDESVAELQVAKHGFVATVVRDAERAWLRPLLVHWRLQTHVSIATRQLRLQAEMAELKAAERDKYSQSLDDYSRVLRSDLERFQFFSQDKRIAVDVLAKKLLREETRYRRLEERHGALEEKSAALQKQLATFVEWDGMALPLAVLALCKDVALSNLRELFLLHATTDDSISSEGEAPAPRLAISSLLRLLEYSTLLEDKLVSRDALADKVSRHLPPYALERGLLFPDFLSGVNHMLGDVLASCERKHEQLKRFWASLLSLLGAPHVRGAAGGEDRVSAVKTSLGLAGAGEGDSGLILCPSRGSWAGRLSDDILQNQEKLLAVLEHETAVVEKAVMEKSSLKHAYPAAEHAVTASNAPGAGVEDGNGAMFNEYQCDPLMPPETTSVPATVTATAVNTSSSVTASASSFLSTSQSSKSSDVKASTATLVSVEVYANWYLASQVRDLFLAFHKPLLQLLVQYSGGQRVTALGNQYCLPLAAVFRMLTDLKLYPAFLSREAVQTLFSRFCESAGSGSSGGDGLLTPQGFTLFFGSCALDLYARSLADSDRAPEFLLSAREVLLSFFGDLGFLAESDIPPVSRLCFVGMEVEAILWPLFEYYASSPVTTCAPDSGAPPVMAEDSRLGMTAATFERFMADIAGQNASVSSVIYRRVMREARGNQLQSQSQSQSQSQVQNTEKLAVESSDEQRIMQSWRMHLDEFYAALALFQTERSAPGTSYASPGDAVRRWLQQAQ